METSLKSHTIASEIGRTRKILADAGLTGAEVKDLFDMDVRARTEFLVSRYDPALAGKALSGLLKAIVKLGERSQAAAFMVEVIKGPAVPAQLLILRAADQPEFRSDPAVDQALSCYQAEFESLTQAYSWYNDPSHCGCKGKTCADMKKKS
jgi:hypothetical protein